MIKPPRLSRRSLLALLAGFPAFAFAPRGRAGPRDQGIGGTGASITPAEGQDDGESDRGIGGTGVIGTIRRFGSIVVNGLRIAYPQDATVRIDGEAATPASLRIGQVVRVVALETGGQFSTHAINVTSEAVGRVEKASAKSLTVLGQSVSLAGLSKSQPRYVVGDTVAVSGLRRPDGVIVASLIERRAPGLEQVAGPVAVGADGAPMVGGLKLSRVDPALIGQRAVLQGHLADGAFDVVHAKAESTLLGSGLKTLSIEAYVERSANGLRLGSGLPVSGGDDAGLPLNRTVRVVLETSPGGGEWRVNSIRLNGTGAPGAPAGMQGPRHPGDGGPDGPGAHTAPAGAPFGRHGSFGAPGAPGLPGQPAGLGASGGPAAPIGAGPSGPGGFGAPGGGEGPGGFGPPGGFGGPGGAGPGGFGPPGAFGGPGGAGPGGFGGMRR